MNQSLLNEYEELLLQRDQLLLDADQIELQYVQAFGEARKNLFEEQIACIRCKKALAWYQQARNHGLSVDPDQLKSYLDHEMLSYQLQLSQMIRDNEAAADTRAVTPYEERRSRSLYRILARKLHPDMHPDLVGDDLLRTESGRRTKSRTSGTTSADGASGACAPPRRGMSAP